MNTSSRAAFERDLRAAVRGNVHCDRAHRGLYATDASIYQIVPQAVVAPRDEEDVTAAVAVAREHGVSILPRGGGTSLAGQAVGESLVVDFSKHLNQVLELNPDRRWARVQPGVVRDNLNALLAPYGLHFAPDPATSSRANVGGMLGNNAAGVRSIVYGKTVDHVLQTSAILSDGTRLDLSELSPEQYDAKAAGVGREADIHRGVRDAIDAHRDEIALRYPKVMRRSGGYNLDELTATDRWNLSKLLVGSEGTLALTLEAKLNLEPLPRHTCVCVVHFAELIEAVRAVASIVALGPSAVEILDDRVVQLARANLSVAPLCDFLEGDPAAVLIVEFYGDTEQEARDKIQAMVADLKSRGMGYAFPVRDDDAGKGRVWAVRKNGLGLMLGMKGDRKPLAFIEDAAVPIDVLAEYIEQVLQICAEEQTEAAMYAHASVGLIHVRPILDLRREDDVRRMVNISERTFELVKKYGGSWSGEHGDGLSRSAYMERFFGPKLYQAFKQVKRLFDPEGLMNPGKIVDAPPIDQSLRYGGGYVTPEFSTDFHFRSDGSFPAAVEMCSGVGTCRQTLAGTMCPSYRATGDESASVRGRANALRLAMSGAWGEDGLTGEDLFDVLDLCLSCKACKSECPSNVDMARLKSEFLHAYRKAHGATMRDRLVAASRRMAEMTSGWKAPFVNAVQRTFPFRWLMEKLAGIDRRRVLPPVARQTLGQWWAARPPSAASGPQVALFADTYADFYEPHVGIAAVELLESCGYRVELTRAGCCQRPRISHGFLEAARREGLVTLRHLQQHIQAGQSVVVLEPSCASALTDDLPDLIDDVELGRCMRENVKMIDVFLREEQQAGRLNAKLELTAGKLLIHGHCHQKSLYGTSAMTQILGSISGVDVELIEAGCCGMAGSFGYEREHYDLSQQIGEDRLFPAVRDASDATIVACGFSCRHQIKDATGITARHWVETLRAQKKP